MPSVALRSFVMVLPLALSACGPKAPEPAASPTVEGSDAAEVSTDWTVENPTDPAVPVDLPTTHMTNQSVATAPAK
ncbi:hypothetical protein ACFOD9_11485 [Novosphingobium bradum]|uniref:Secreted protein n=1 Tax=Novosphingobium bradum TaxID=1737444 RepID=A0ABV7IQC5_9SPHN